MSYRKEIARQLSLEFDGDIFLHRRILRRSLDILADCLLKDGRIEIRDFGVFEIKKYQVRAVKHPVTKKLCNLSEKRIRFRPCKKITSLLKREQIDNK